MNSHPWGYYYMLTGHPPDTARYATAQLEPLGGDWPFLGSVVSAKVASPTCLPAAVQLPWYWDLMAGQPYCGGFAGRLGRVYDPFVIGFDQKTTQYAKTNGRLFEYAGRAAPALAGVGDSRSDAAGRTGRRPLPGVLASCSAASRHFSAPGAGHGRLRSLSAAGLLALDLTRGEAGVGPGAGAGGSPRAATAAASTANALMCRRLVEAGVPFINFQWLAPREYYYNWDCHVDNFLR